MTQSKGFFEVIEISGRTVETIAFAGTRQELAQQVNLGSLQDNQRVVFHAHNMALPPRAKVPCQKLFEVCQDQGRTVETIASAPTLGKLASVVDLALLSPQQKVFVHKPGSAAKQISRHKLSKAAARVLRQKTSAQNQM